MNSKKSRIILFTAVMIIALGLYFFSDLGGLKSLTSSVINDEITVEQIQADIDLAGAKLLQKNIDLSSLEAIEATLTEDQSNESKQTEIESLKREVKDLEQKKSDLETMLKEHQDKVAEAEQKKYGLIFDDLATIESKLTPLSEAIPQLQSNITAATALLNAEGKKQIAAYNAVDIEKNKLFELNQKFEPLKAQYDILKARIEEITLLTSANTRKMTTIDDVINTKKVTKEANIKMIAEKNKEKVSNTTLIATKTTAMNSNANLLTQKNASKAANIASITTATQQKQSNTESINQKTNTKNNNVSRIAQMSKEKEANLGLISAKTKEKEVQQQKLYTLERALTGDRKSTKYKQAEKLVNDQKAVVTKITAEITTLMFRNSQMGSEITTLTNNNAWLSGEIKGLIAANATLDTEIVRLGNVGTQLDTEIAGLTKVVNVLVGEIADLGVRNTTLTKEVDQLTKENTSIDADVVVQTKSKTQLVSTNTTLSTELTAKKNSVAAMEKSTADYQKQSAQISVQKETIEKAEKTLEETNKIVAQKQGEIGEMYDDVATKSVEKEKLEAEKSSKISMLTEKIRGPINAQDTSPNEEGYVSIGGDGLYFDGNTENSPYELQSTKTKDSILWQDDPKKEYIGKYVPLSIYDIVAQSTIDAITANMTPEAKTKYLTAVYPGVEMKGNWSGMYGGEITTEKFLCNNGSWHQQPCRLCPAGEVMKSTGCEDPLKPKTPEVAKTNTCTDTNTDNKDDTTGDYCCPDVDNDNHNDNNPELLCVKTCDTENAERLKKASKSCHVCFYEGDDSNIDFKGECDVLLKKGNFDLKKAIPSKDTNWSAIESVCGKKDISNITVDINTHSCPAYNSFLHYTTLDIIDKYYKQGLKTLSITHLGCATYNQPTLIPADNAKILLLALKKIKYLLNISLTANQLPAIGLNTDEFPNSEDADSYYTFNISSQCKTKDEVEGVVTGIPAPCHLAGTICGRLEDESKNVILCTRDGQTVKMSCDRYNNIIARGGFVFGIWKNSLSIPVQ